MEPSPSSLSMGSVIHGVEGCTCDLCYCYQYDAIFLTNGPKHRDCMGIGGGFENQCSSHLCHGSVMGQFGCWWHHTRVHTHNATVVRQLAIVPCTCMSWCAPALIWESTQTWLEGWLCTSVGVTGSVLVNTSVRWG